MPSVKCSKYENPAPAGFVMSNLAGAGFSLQIQARFDITNPAKSGSGASLLLLRLLLSAEDHTSGQGDGLPQAIHLDLLNESLVPLVTAFC